MTVEQDVATLQAQVAQLQSALTTLQGQAQSIGTDVNALKSWRTTLTATLDQWNISINEWKAQIDTWKTIARRRLRKLRALDTRPIIHMLDDEEIQPDDEVVLAAPPWTMTVAEIPIDEATGLPTQEWVLANCPCPAHSKMRNDRRLA